MPGCCALVNQAGEIESLVFIETQIVRNNADVIRLVDQTGSGWNYDFTGITPHHNYRLVATRRRLRPGGR